MRAVTGVIRLRAARVIGFNAVLEPLKVGSKLSEFRYFNTKTPIIGSNITRGFKWVSPLKLYIKLYIKFYVKCYRAL